MSESEPNAKQIDNRGALLMRIVAISEAVGDMIQKAGAMQTRFVEELRQISKVKRKGYTGGASVNGHA
jgi:hypothetical protein